MGEGMSQITDRFAMTPPLGVLPPGDREGTERRIARLEREAAAGSDYARRVLPGWRDELRRIEESERYWREVAVNED